MRCIKMICQWTTFLGRGRTIKVTTINITSNYHLTHCFDIPNASWSDKGWVYDPNLILHPQLMYEHHFHSRKNTTIRVSDCLYYKIVPWMRILNASTFTTWSVSERSYDVDFKFVLLFPSC